MLFASIRRLNRLSHLYCKDTREQTQEVTYSCASLQLGSVKNFEVLFDEIAEIHGFSQS